MTETRSIPIDLARKIIDSQLPTQTKLDQAHSVIWNDGSIESLDDQLDRFLETISSNMGS